jgi:hypothetical protein
MKLGITGTRENLTGPQLRLRVVEWGYGFSAAPAAPCAMKPWLWRVGSGLRPPERRRDQGRHRAPTLCCVATYCQSLARLVCPHKHGCRDATVD